MNNEIILEPNKCTNILYKSNTEDNIASCFYIKNKDGIKKQMNKFRYCRELLIDDLTKNIHKVDKQKLRLLMSGWSNKKNAKESIVDKIKIGINVANIVSKKFKMQPIKNNINYNKVLPNNPIIEVIASPKWQRSPYMLSLFTMFTKYCNNNKFKNVKTYEELCIIIDKNKFITNGLKLNSKSITFFLSNYNKFFGNLPTITNYQVKSYILPYKSNIQHEGITKVITNNSSHKILNKKFLKLFKNI